MTEGVATIGVPAVDGPIEPERIVAAIDDAGAEARVVDPSILAGDPDGDDPGDASSGDPDDASDDDPDDDSRDALDAVVVSGTPGVRAIANQRLDVPILPVEIDCGLPSVSLDDLEDAIGAVAAGAAETELAPLLSVAVDGDEVATAFREVSLITAEPARISEFAVDHEETGHLDTVRADGVVVATPAGSRGYAAAGDGPLLAPGTGLAVVPVAPFRTVRDRWVVPLGRVGVGVQRDEATVTVEGDGEVLASVGRDATVTLSPAGTLSVLVVEESTHSARSRSA